MDCEIPVFKGLLSTDSQDYTTRSACTAVIGSACVRQGQAHNPTASIATAGPNCRERRHFKSARQLRLPSVSYHMDNPRHSSHSQKS